jgi:acyl-CoA hydrolase
VLTTVLQPPRSAHPFRAVLRRTVTLKDGSSRIKPTLAPFSAVTTGVHFVDKIVTEHGVAELEGRSLSERARALIAVAAPEHREHLSFEARRAGLL